MGSLTLVATPLGNKDDIGLRALEILKKSEVIILEERKESSAFLRSHGISGKEYPLLNEHTTSEELQALKKICAEKDVALITDCGTPGFCDPGADLVRVCRQAKIPVYSVPGPSSLMMLLSLSGRRIDQFHFAGFIPQETEERVQFWKKLSSEKTPVVFMDTPYRFRKTLEEWKTLAPESQGLLGLDFTQSTERVWEGSGAQLFIDSYPKKAEFLLMIFPAQGKFR
ncbi:MAG: SAM-dependent methyltransferase [Pseudobdellovibrionaceae bacterium]